jgi:hypothetical protein
VIIQDSIPAKVLAVGRLVPGTSGESRRSAHLFDVEAGGIRPEELLARCGAVLKLTDIEWLALGSGMPCERCLGLTGATDQAQPRRELGA